MQDETKKACIEGDITSCQANITNVACVEAQVDLNFPLFILSAVVRNSIYLFLYFVPFV